MLDFLVDKSPFLNYPTYIMQSVDENLIILTSLLATGANIHAAANRIAAYKGTFWLLKQHPDKAHEELFKEAETELRMFLANLRKEKLTNLVNG